MRGLKNWIYYYHYLKGKKYKMDESKLTNKEIWVKELSDINELCRILFKSVVLIPITLSAILVGLLDVIVLLIGEMLQFLRP